MQNDKDLLICKPACNFNWLPLFEDCFESWEREPSELLSFDISNGTRLAYTTELSSGRQICFSIVYSFKNFNWIDYLGVDDGFRSRGIGTSHLKELIKICKESSPLSKGLFGAIHSPAQTSISKNTYAHRKKLKDLYLYLGAKFMSEKSKFFFPTYTELAKPTPAELLWFEFNTRVNSDDLNMILPVIYTQVFEFKPEVVDQLLPLFNG